MIMTIKSAFVQVKKRMSDKDLLELQEIIEEEIDRRNNNDIQNRTKRI